MRLFKLLPGYFDTLLANVNSASIRSAVDRFCCNRKRPILLLVMISLLLYLPGVFSRPPMDRDESRYAQASKQMVETGDYTRIYFQEKFRNRKPVGIYWLQAGVVNLLGGDTVKDKIWPYRMPSLFCAIGTVLLMFLTARRILGGNGPGLAAGLLMAVSPLMLELARTATTDSALLFATFVAMFNLMQLYMGLRKGEKPKLLNALLFWIAAGAGTLIKGPLTLVAGLATVIGLMILHRDFKLVKALRPWIGIPILLAIVMPWLISIQIATDGAFLRDSLFGDFGKKLISGRESHGGLPGYHTLILAFTSWPCSLLAVPAVFRAWQDRNKSAVSAFCFCWFVPFLIIVELVPTKLPHYILPAYPAIVLLTVSMVWNNPEFELGPRVIRWIHAFYRFAWKLFLPIIATAILLTAIVNRYPLLSILTAVIIAVGAVFVSSMRKRSSLGALLGGAMVMLVATPLMFGVIAPRLDSFFMNRDVAKKVAEIRQVDPELRLYSVEYREPSLVFLTGTDTRLCKLETIESDYNIHMAALLSDSDVEKLSVPLVKAASFSGINISKGKSLDLGLYLHPASGYEKHQ